MNKKLFFAIGLIANFTFAQTYNNGNLSTGATSSSGTPAPAGYTWSELQNDTGNTTESNRSSGFSASGESFLADDFIIPPGEQWQISFIDFFAYQPGYMGTTNPFVEVTVKIYSSDPSFPGAPIVYDGQSNRFVSGEDAMMYRIANTTVPATVNTSTDRKIFKVKADIPVTLGPGTYWIRYQITDATQFNQGNGASSPTVTIPGSRTLPSFNAKSFLISQNQWKPLIDKGNPLSAPDVNLDLPFIITYTSTSLGTNETVQYDNSVQVYPNPVKETFRISNIENLKVSNIVLIDMSGKLIRNLKVSEEYNVSDLPKGNYLLKIESDKTTKIAKLIKQ